MTEAADQGWMRRAIALARPMVDRTGKNPAVGCVLVKDGHEIAAAATAAGGRPHAEEQALGAARETAAGAVAYVTLEPCGVRSSGEASCAALLVQAGVARVVIACRDASPYASGRGAERLRDAGIEVEIGILEREAAGLYATYAHRPSERGD